MQIIEWAGLLTHTLVFMLGIGGIAGFVPLPRKRRSGAGLVLMALSMLILMVQPRLQMMPMGAAAGHAVSFMIALWLLIGPVSDVETKVNAATHHGERT